MYSTIFSLMNLLIMNYAFIYECTYTFNLYVNLLPDYFHMPYNNSQFYSLKNFIF